MGLLCHLAMSKGKCVYTHLERQRLKAGLKACRYSLLQPVSHCLPKLPLTILGVMTV